MLLHVTHPLLQTVMNSKFSSILIRRCDSEEKNLTPISYNTLNHQRDRCSHLLIQLKVGLNGRQMLNNNHGTQCSDLLAIFLPTIKMQKGQEIELWQPSQVLLPEESQHFQPTVMKDSLDLGMLMFINQYLIMIKSSNGTTSTSFIKENTEVHSLRLPLRKEKQNNSSSMCITS